MTLSGPDFFFPSGPTTTAVGNAANLDNAIDFAFLPFPLQGLGTRIIYIAPNNSLFNLAGPNAGRESVRIAQQVMGDQQWPFKQVLSNSPYIMGANINRQNISERTFNVGIVIGQHNPPLTEYAYRIAEANWWAGQDEANDGWLGIYTRFSGWRWIPVRPSETVKSPEQQDPTAYGNNASRWDITWLATRPFFTKPALYLTFQAANAGPPRFPPLSLIGPRPALASLEYYWGSLPIVNRGDLPSYVGFLVSSPGQAIVQDNLSSRLVTLPLTTAATGTYLVDTEPSKRTLTAAGDPTENLLFDTLRQSTILNFLLSGILGEGVPLMMQFPNRFIYQIPPQTEVTFTVAHSNPSGTVTAFVPQRFKRSR